ncbi:MFS transporter, partial [Brevibacillus fortis]
FSGNKRSHPFRMVFLCLRLYFGGVVVGLGSGCTASVLGAMIANRWFVKQRGLVMGILTASGATGQLVFLPLLASLAESDGWRTVSWVIATAALIWFRSWLS